MAGGSDTRRWLGRAWVVAVGSLLLCIVGVLSIALSDVQEWHVVNDPYGHSAAATEPDSTLTALVIVAGVVLLWTGLVGGLLIWGLKGRQSFQRTASPNRTLLQRLPPDQYRDVILTAALFMWATVAAVVGTGSILLTLQHS